MTKIDPTFIPLYIFVFSVIGLIAWELVKFIVFVAGFRGTKKNKK